MEEDFVKQAIRPEPDGGKTGTGGSNSATALAEYQQKVTEFKSGSAGRSGRDVLESFANKVEIVVAKVAGGLDFRWSWIRAKGGRRCSMRRALTSPVIEEFNRAYP